MPGRKARNDYQDVRGDGMRSGFEADVHDQLRAAGVEPNHEVVKVPFIQPAKPRTWLVDFTLLHNGIALEAKGRFNETEERRKFRLIKEQWPALDLRMVFQNAKQKISKGSKTTVADWCDKQGIPWAHRVVPDSWLREPVNEKSLAILRRLMEEQGKDV